MALGLQISALGHTVVSGTGLGRAAFYCYPVLKANMGSIPFSFNCEEMAVVGGFENNIHSCRNDKR